MTIPFHKALLFLLFALPLLLFPQAEQAEPEKKIFPDYALSLQINGDSLAQTTDDLQKAIQLLQEGKYKKAIRTAKKKQKKQPQIENWYFIQAIAYQSLNKEKKVEKVFEEAFEKLPSTALLYYNYGIKKLKDKNFAEADQFVQQSLQLHSAFPEAHLTLSKIHEQQGNRIKAILPLYAYFLFDNENNGLAVEKLKQLLYHGIEVVQENGLTFSVPFSKENKDSEMLKMEIMLNELNQVFNEENAYDQKKLLAFTESIFNQLNEKKQFQEDIWWSFYAEILGNIAEKGLIKAFVYMDLESNSLQAKEYMYKQQEESKEYKDWKKGL